ncbi:MAG: MATE family efflux transporter [Atopobiaceae bacterium]
MVHGSLADKIVLFALPVAITAILQQLYNVADIATTGQFVSTAAMAAVGSNSSTVSLLVALFQGISLGANVVIATAIGANKPEDASRAAHTALVIAVVGGIIFAALSELVVTPLLNMLMVPDEIFDMAALYLRIYMAGLPVVFLYDFEAAIFRSIGDTFTPLYTLLVSSALNVVLDLIVTIQFGWGADGVAATTVISTGVAAVILFVQLLHTDSVVRIEIPKIRVDGAALKQILVIGLPAGVQGAFFSLANIVIQGGINSLGQTVIAGNSAAQSIESITYFTYNSFGQACTTFVGQNHGANQPVRCRKTLKVCMAESLICGVILIALVVSFGRILVGFFDSDPAVIEQGYLRITIVIYSQIFCSFNENFSGFLRGYGLSLAPAFVTIFSIVGLRLIYVATVFAHNPTYPVLLTVYPISLGVNAACLVILYFFVRKFSRRVA